MRKNMCAWKKTARQSKACLPALALACLTIAIANISLPFKLQATCFEFWRFLSDLHASIRTCESERERMKKRCTMMGLGWRIVRSRTSHHRHYHWQFCTPALNMDTEKELEWKRGRERETTVNQSFVQWMKRMRISFNRTTSCGWWRWWWCIQFIYSIGFYV